MRQGLLPIFQNYSSVIYLACLPFSGNTLSTLINLCFLNKEQNQILLALQGLNIIDEENTKDTSIKT